MNTEKGLTPAECKQVFDLARRRRWKELADTNAVAKLEPLVSRYLLEGETWASASPETKGRWIWQLCCEVVDEDLRTSEGVESPGKQVYLVLKGYYLDRLTHEVVMEQLGVLSQGKYYNDLRPRAFESLAMALRNRLMAMAMGVVLSPESSGVEVLEGEVLEHELDSSGQRIYGSPVTAVVVEDHQSERADGPAGPEYPAPTTISITRSLSNRMLATNEELELCYQMENPTSGTPMHVVVKPEIPAEFRLVESEPETEIDLQPGQTAFARFHLMTSKEGQFVFPAHSIRCLEETTVREHSCPMEQLEIEAYFSATAQFVGRRRELQLLARLRQLTSGGRGQAVIISGEAGVGKSRMVEEFIRISKRMGFVGIHSKCSEFHEEMPFFPFREICESMFETLAVDPEQASSLDSVDGLSSLEVELQHPVQSLAPFVRDGMPGRMIASSQGKHGLQPTDEREQFFFAFRNFLQGFSKDRPTILWLDDLQCCDSGSLSLLEFLVSHLKEMAVMVIGTYRAEEVSATAEDRHKLRQTLRKLTTEDMFHEVDLQPLAEEDIYAFVDSMFPESHFPDDFSRTIFIETEGNPFFAVSVLRSLIASGLILRETEEWRFAGDLATIDIPDRVETVIQGRLESIDGSRRQDLETASIIGRQFPFHILMKLSDAEEDLLISHLEDYMNYDLIRELSLEDERYEFSHGKIQQVVYESIPGLRRRRLHQKVAAVLESVYASGLESIAPMLALHYSRAGNASAALEHLLKAIKLNATCYNLAEAWGEVGHATQLLDQLTDNSQRDRFRNQLTKEIGNLHKNQGEYIEAEQAYASCLEYARAGGVLLEEAWALDNLGDIYNLRDQYGEAESYYLQCKAIVESLHNEELYTEVVVDLGELYYRMGVWLGSQGKAEEASQTLEQSERYLSEVLAGASSNGDWELLRRAHDYLGIIHATRGELDKAIEAYQMSLSIARQHGLSRQALNSLGEAYRQMGRFQEAVQCYNEFHEFAVQASAKREQVLALNNIGVANYEQGDYLNALESLGLSLALNEEVGYTGCQIESLIIMGLVFDHQGEGQRALEMYEASLRLFDNLDESDGVAEVLLKVGTERYANGEFEQAGYFFERHLAMKPTAGDSAEIKTMLERVALFSKDKVS